MKNKQVQHSILHGALYGTLNGRTNESTNGSTRACFIYRVYMNYMAQYCWLAGRFYFEQY